MYIPTFADVEAAQERIRPYIHRTPVLTSSYLNGLSGAELFFKCENFQKAAAFKVRGASNAVFGLSAEQAARGVATHSSGNHGLSLAYAAGRREPIVFSGFDDKLSPGTHRIALRAGDGDSSISFWWRRCVEHSRSPRCTTCPC